MNRFGLGIMALAASTAIASPAFAQSTVINFDDLSGYNVLPINYAGVNWRDNFVYYSAVQNPYTPSSAPTRIFGNYANFPIDTPSSMSFLVGAGSVFDGFFLAGNDAAGAVSFDLYNGATLVASSAALTPTDTPTFLASNYGGAITEVRINAINGYWVGDDFTFSRLNAIGGAVPEPASWALMIVGFGAVGGAMRSRRRSTRVTFAA